jgi:hypothetical protein
MLEQTVALGDRQHAGNDRARGIEALAQQVEHDAGPAVESARSQGRAARRAGDAHEALDTDGTLAQFAVEFAEAFGVGVEALPAKAFSMGLVAIDIVVGERLLADAVGTRQQLTDHAAA